MPDIRIKDLTTQHTSFTGEVATDDPTLGTRRFPLSTIPPLFVARQPADILISNGANANRAVVQPGTAKTALAGVSRASMFVEPFDVPTSNPSLTAWLNVVSSASNNPELANRSALALATTGSLNVDATAASALNFIRFSYPGFRAAYSGQRVALLIDPTQGSATNPVVWILVGGAGGAWTDISSSFTLSTAGTPPDWLDANLSNGFHLTGFNWPAGIAPRGGWILGHPSAEDRAFYAQNGRWPLWVTVGGDVRNLIADVSRNSTFAAGATDWTAAGTGSSIAIVGGALEITSGVNSGAGLTSTFINGGTPVVGHAYEWAFDVVSVSGGVWSLLIGGSNEPVAVPVTLVSGQRTVAARVVQLVGGGQPFRLTCSTSGQVLVIDNVSFGQLGSLTLSALTPDRVVRDISQVGPLCNGYLVGHTPQTDLDDSWIEVQRTGAGFFMADTQLVGNGREVVDAIVLATDATTFSLGDSAGAPATIVGSIALSAGVRTRLTVIPKTGTTKLYGASTVSTPLRLWVRTARTGVTLV